MVTYLLAYILIHFYPILWGGEYEGLPPVNMYVADPEDAPEPKSNKFDSNFTEMLRKFVHEGAYEHMFYAHLEDHLYTLRPNVVGRIVGITLNRKELLVREMRALPDGIRYEPTSLFLHKVPTLWESGLNPYERKAKFFDHTDPAQTTFLLDDSLSALSPVTKELILKYHYLVKLPQGRQDRTLVNRVRNLLDGRLVLSSDDTVHQIVLGRGRNDIRLMPVKPNGELSEFDTDDYPLTFLESFEYRLILNKDLKDFPCLKEDLVLFPKYIGGLK